MGRKVTILGFSPHITNRLITVNVTIGKHTANNFSLVFNDLGKFPLSLISDNTASALRYIHVPNSNA